MVDDEPLQSKLDLARDVYLDYALRLAEGARIELDEVCARHPDLAPHLRRLDADGGGVERREGFSDPGPAGRAAGAAPARSDPRAPCTRAEELGRGGMGIVYRAWDPQLERTLAMKVLRPGAARIAGPDERRSRRERFLNEARVTARLDHPCIVPVHELGFDADESPYFTMKLVDGRDLRAVFESVWTECDGWTLARAMGVVLKVCEALEYAHQKGVVHRDVKPSNVMVGRFGEVYLMDWGVARALGATSSGGGDARNAAGDGEDPHLTAEGDVLGTAVYMAPEQARGERDAIGPAVDVYSVGAMLYHLLARSAPFVDTSSTSSTAEVLERVRSGPPERLSWVAARVPAELVAISEKAMAREPQRRYASMADMAADVRAWLEGRVVRAHRSGIWSEARAWVRRNPIVASLATAVAVALLAIGLSFNATVRARRDLEYHGRLGTPSDLLERSRSLWPAMPSNLERMERWVRDADDLQARIGDAAALRARLEALRARALPPTADDVARDEARLRERELKLRRLVAHYEQQRELMSRAPPEARNDQNESLADVILLTESWKESLRRVGETVYPRTTWRFADVYEQLLHDRMAQMLPELEVVIPGGDRGLIECVRDAIEFARTVERRSLVDAAEGWEAACASIASREECPPYDGLRIRPQLGLVPLGRDPITGLWEFAHLQSGEPAVRDARGLLEIREETGLVLVLIPGATMFVGTQDDDPLRANYDELHQFDEGPTIGLVIDPFFLSKYEMTRAQWRRATQVELPDIPVDSSWIPTDTLAVSGVAWPDARDVAQRLGLVLPTEAQWEHAARGGGSLPWWFGDSLAELARHANLFDVSHVAIGGPVKEVQWSDFLPYDDGWQAIAPVGMLCPNPFGLHDVLGNVSEWCLDEGTPDQVAPRLLGTGERLGASGGSRVHRGGGTGQSWPAARISARGWLGGGTVYKDIGLRPARKLDS